MFRLSVVSTAFVLLTCDLARAADPLDCVPRSAQVVEMRYFGGMSYPEVATALETSISTVQREWRTAKAWLLREVSRGSSA